MYLKLIITCFFNLTVSLILVLPSFVLYNTLITESVNSKLACLNNRRALMCAVNQGAGEAIEDIVQTENLIGVFGETDSHQVRLRALFQFVS